MAFTHPGATSPRTEWVARKDIAGDWRAVSEANRCPHTRMLQREGPKRAATPAPTAQNQEREMGSDLGWVVQFVDLAVEPMSL